MQASLSVALVTRNRPGSLERCLSSWRALRSGPDEIVVSDDSDDAHLPACAEVAARHGARHQRGPRRGLYANRNAASLACTGSHIISADDDHTHPTDYVAAIRALVAQDPERVWIFSERNPGDWAGALTCPPELHRSGHGAFPADPSDCAAISDGASVYPRGVFDAGLRYDDAYRFGALWYLWGRRLRRAGRRISFSDTTFVFHHNETDGRLSSPAAVADQLEVMQYALFVNALWLDRSPAAAFWSVAYALRRLVAQDRVVHYHHATRLGPGRLFRAARLALTAGPRYRPVA